MAYHDLKSLRDSIEESIINDSDQENHAFLVSGYDSDESFPRNGARRIPLAILIPWFLNVCFIGTILGVLLKLNLNARNKSDLDSLSLRRKESVNSPAPDLIDYVPIVMSEAFWDVNPSPYQGMPTDEKDKLWDEMYGKGINIHISPEEHNTLVNISEHIPLPGFEGDYAVGLDIFHRLHCLNVIRKTFYPRRYKWSMTKPGGSVDYIQWKHIDHCIEAIRQALTCHADVSMIAFAWDEPTKMLGVRADTVHICRNFSKIQDWAFSRFVYMDKNVSMKHVEDGKIVDYSSLGHESHAWHEKVPEGWHYTVEDL